MMHRHLQKQKRRTVPATRRAQFTLNMWQLCRTYHGSSNIRNRNISVLILMFLLSFKYIVKNRTNQFYEHFALNIRYFIIIWRKFQYKYAFYYQKNRKSAFCRIGTPILFIFCYFLQESMSFLRSRTSNLKRALRLNGIKG